MKIILAALILALCTLTSAAETGSAETLIALDPEYLPDRPFPELIRWIQDGWDLKRGLGDPVPYEKAHPPGATIRLFLHNTSDKPVDADGICLDGLDLGAQLRPRGKEHQDIRAAHFLLNDTDLTTTETRRRLSSLGGPVWWQVRPNPIPPGAVAEAVIRLRRLPAGQRLLVAVKSGDTQSAECAVTTTNPSSFRIASLCFGENGKLPHVYIREENKQPFTIETLALDGRPAALPPQTCRNSAEGFLPIAIACDPPLAHGSFHHIRAVTTDGRTASAVIRARDDFFALGMWGYRRNGDTDAEQAANVCRVFQAHLFNTHMGMAGNQSGFLWSSEGLTLLEKTGLRHMPRDPWGPTIQNRQIYAYFLLDEPDAHEYAVNDLPPDERLGSYAQGIVEKQKNWARADPRNLALLNVDLTYKPDNWLTYGPLPDILALDPYYQGQLMTTYHKHPGWLAQYCHPFFVFAAAEVGRSGSEPRPFHVILNSVSYQDGDRVFRYGTPEEKRVEFYYSLSAGAKGISYWWFTPYGECRGCGSDDTEARAMMAELARLNAEARALEPLLALSHVADVPGRKTDSFATARPAWLTCRTLFSGQDTALVILVNRDHASDRIGSLFAPIPRGEVTFRTPPWLKPVLAVRSTRDGAIPVEFMEKEGSLVFTLEDVALTEVLVITKDAALAERIMQHRAGLDRLAAEAHKTP